jgi:Ca2+-transporting ATPase
VRGDILVLTEGDRVPADAILLSCSNLSTDESLLTGESLPVRKIASVTGTTSSLAMARPGGDDLPFVYSGTLVVQGQGMAQVQATGAQTEMGKIGHALQTVKSEVTPLQREMTQLVSRLVGIALSLCVAVVVIYGLTRGDWLKGILAGITLAMAILPNEFPVVVTIFLALGAWRISQNHVLARRTSAIETLGSATVLCVDKTGTLTLNQMAVQQLLAYDHSGSPHSYNLALHSREPLPETVHELVEFCILASQRDPFDPMEKAALHNEAMKSGEKRCSVQDVARLISVKTGSRKVNKITFVRSADGSFLTPILRLLDTRMSLSESASECTSMAQDFEPLNGSKRFIIRP